MGIPTDVLITGADGFTGRYLEAELRARGVRTVGLTGGEGREGHRGVDLRDPESIRLALKDIRIDAVIHLAAISFVAHGDPLAMYAVNTIGTQNLLEALLATGQRPHVVLAGTGHVYGLQPGPHHEGLCPAPTNHYGLSKLSMEHIGRLYCDRLPVTVARLFNYTGRGQSDQFLIPKIVRHFRESLPVIELGNIDVARDFLDVRDVVAAYIRLLEGPPLFPVNICSGRSIALRQAVDICSRLTGHDIEIRVNPAFVREGDIVDLYGDNGQMRRLGWEPRYSFEDTLRSMLAE